MFRVVVGGQAGSESKGRTCADLHKRYPHVAGVRVGGPNAGHTVVGKDASGKETAFAFRHLPVAAVADPNALLVIAAGSEIDIAVLESEIKLAESAGYEVSARLVVDESATVIEETHRLAESGLKNGTTGKGIGGARAARLMRSALLAKDFEQLQPYTMASTSWMLNQWVDGGQDVLIEGTQGYSLGTHAGHYPYCTSGDCRAIDFLAQVGATPFSEVEVWLVARTYPIRIAGNSGPLKDETTWSEIGVPAEMTTVTKKVRRVGQWDAAQVQAAVAANGGRKVKVSLAFGDYWWPELKHVEHRTWQGLPAYVKSRVAEIEEQIGARIEQIGYGPDSAVWR